IDGHLGCRTMCFTSSGDLDRSSPDGRPSVSPRNRQTLRGALMVSVEQHRGTHLVQLERLVNRHLAGVMPGWQLPARVIASSLESLPEDGGRDPWVTKRRTLCAMEDDRLLGAAHVLHYGSGPEVGAAYRDAAELAWLLFWPDAQPAAQALVHTARNLV